MKTKVLSFLIACACVCSVLVTAHAADTNTQPLLNTCTACHGAKGLSVDPTWPNLAGQKEEYLRTQLLAFRNGKRNDPLMSTVAKNLSDDQIKALATYYSRLPLPRTKKSDKHTRPPLEPSSRPLVFCVRCHRGDGLSTNDIWPSLAGQNQAYMEKQMQAYYSGERKDDMMALWGKMVDEAQLGRILRYFSQQGR